MNRTGQDLGQSSAKGKRRIEAIDLARGLALVAMAIYHFAWDLEFFGYAEPGMTTSGGWRLFARSIASSFLFLVGFSLFLAHAKGVRWPSFLRRLGMVAAAALAISLATWYAVPQGFIFFGILHHIALASLIGLAFLRLPALALLLLAVLVVIAPAYLRSAFFDHPALWWAGLSADIPRSNDYVPIFPFFAAVLGGIAVARLMSRGGALARLSQVAMPDWTAPLQFAGRHSLAVYLLHQPLLIGVIWLYAQAFPPGPADPSWQFARACQTQCEEQGEAEFCSIYCVCVLDRIETDGLLPDVLAGRQSPETDEILQGIALQCTLDAGLAHEGEDVQ
jgi:uncharacterized membrane protein